MCLFVLVWSATLSVMIGSWARVVVRRSSCRRIACRRFLMLGDADDSDDVGWFGEFGWLRGFDARWGDCCQKGE